MKSWILTITILLLTANSLCAELSLTDLSKSDLSLKQEQDIRSIKIYRQGIESIMDFVMTRHDLFPPKKRKDPKLIQSSLRKEAMVTWKTLLDYYMALDSIAAFHRDFLKIKDKKGRHLSYCISRAATYTQYRYAIDFITASEKNPSLDTIFNEAVPDLGLPDGIYKKFKYRFLNIIKASEFTAYEALEPYFKAAPDIAIQSMIQQDRKKIWRGGGKGQGITLTFKNGFDILNKKGHRAWFPVQKGVSNWMGNTKVYRKEIYLIQPSQIEQNRSLLKPGDILLERREWYLTNVGIPGFWSHAALYIGTPREREKIFNDPETLKWVHQQNCSSFEELLKKTYSHAYKKSITRQQDNHHPRVIEAIAKGVVFTTLEYSASCDSLAVLRPRLSNKEIAVAIFRAFKYWGRPYDYNFDFLTENSLVCSELIYKAYESDEQTKGLTFPSEKVLNHMVTPVNAFAKQFAQNYGTKNQQTDLILFLDGYERTKRAKRSNIDTFIKSWQRPKWHILIHKET